MKNREIDVRDEYDNFFGFSKRGSGHQVVHVAAIAIFYDPRLRLTGVGDQVLVGCKKIMQVEPGHDAQREKQEQRAGSKTLYDRVFLQASKFVTWLQIKEFV